MNEIGNWAFIIGLIVVLIGSFVTVPQLTLILVVLGLIVGFLNITTKEIDSFLIGVIALVAAGGANISQIPAIGDFLQNILGNLTVFVAPAAIVVAIKAIYELASRK